MKKRIPNIETQCLIDVAVFGSYSPAEPSVGLSEGISDFQIMLGSIDVTDAIPDREHQCLYNMLLDELRGSL
jgi:hypothetical protein